MVRIAVIGTGGWGKNHVRVLSELGHLVAVCDLDASRATVYAEKYRVKGYSDVGEMLEEVRQGRGTLGKLVNDPAIADAPMDLGRVGGGVGGRRSRCSDHGHPCESESRGSQQTHRRTSSQGDSSKSEGPSAWLFLGQLVAGLARRRASHEPL